MKLRVLLLSTILLNLSLIQIHGYSQDVKWKGTIEEEDGTKIIKNPNEPLYGEITFDLEEDLTIGNEEDENYMFHKGIWLEVDSGGNIFVLDRGNCRIQKYDEEGKYLQTIGRKGQGPGEFESPDVFCLDSKDNLYVQDGRHIDIFNKEGKFKRSYVSFDFFYPFFGITGERNILAKINSTKNLIKGTEEIILVSSEGEKIKTIASFPYEKPSPLQKGKFKLYIGDPYGAGLLFCFINEGMAVYGYSSEYRLFVINSSGEISRIIEKDQPGELFTRKDKNKIIDKWVEIENRRKSGPKYSRGKIKEVIRFPKYKSFYSLLLKDDKNRIYIREYRPILFDNEESASFDLFNGEGYYLYKAIIPLHPRFIKNGYLYRVERDEETDYRRIKRYKIKNWNQIKTGIN